MQQIITVLSLIYCQVNVSPVVEIIDSLQDIYVYIYMFTYLLNN